MDEILRVQGLRRHFAVPGGVLKALDGVDFEVTRGETLGIVGESGCGKSTLARTIVGIEQATDGEVKLGGLGVRGASRKQRQRLARLCQMIFQDPYASLNPRMKVRDIVAEPLVVHGVGSRSERTAQVKRLLARVGLPAGSEGRLPHEFSGGQRQRIGIARALALRPKIIVADEPVSALDVSVQAQILNLLCDLRDELGLTLLLVSHDLQVVEWMSDRVMVMYLGRIVELGPADRVFDRPGHPYTQALIASAPRIRAKDDRADRVEEATLDGEVPSAIAPPTGCAFHPRCALATARCRTACPPRVECTPGHTVSCHEVA